MADKLAIAKKYIDLNYKVRIVLKACGLSKSSWYYHQNKKENNNASLIKIGRPIPGFSYLINGTTIEDSEIIIKLKNFRNQIEFSNGGGCKLIPYYFKRDFGIIINHKKVCGICKKEKLLLPKEKKNNKNKKICENRKINKPNMLWQFDIKTGYIVGLNHHFYFMAIFNGHN